MKKSVIFIADSLDNAHKFQQVLSGLDVEVSAGSSVQFEKLVVKCPVYDLVICEAYDDAHTCVERAERIMGTNTSAALLAIVEEQQLASFRIPLQIKSDFVMHGASSAECEARIRRLLWLGEESTIADVLSVDTMSINLATYQVMIAGEPLDFTYLEYALLAFLVTHPDRTYSRDSLLRRVWGFDYYGGSRTVDVHVRRVRAKLGPELAQRLETTRGVGYLWKA